ncbi:UNVERIFIED_CONTAM: hypothetical protein GTU68_013734, partial [Idotea baltica]|nr:hypothetical protein [Idotea baltica]
MSIVNPLSLSERLHTALNQTSLILRCQEISQLLQEVSSKDGGYLLRTVIESVFGATEEGTMSLQQQQLGGGWGLRIITLTDHRAEFQTMRAFLAPNGPLLNLIYRLSHDPFQLLPFPIAWLPAKVRSEILEGSAGSFYMSKIQNLGPGKNPTNILFNAFEFYMFHFGYFLVGSGAQRWNLLWTSVRDSLYPTLLEDYLSSYLPCDANLPPGPPTAPVSPRGILSPVSQRAPSMNPYHSNPPNLSLLVSPIGPPFKSFDPNPLMDTSVMGGLGMAAHQTSSPLHPSVSPLTEVSTWTSQALIQVLMEIWINLCVPPPTTRSTHTTHLYPSQPSICAPHPALKDVFVPMADHVRAVRMMVKHFHYFSNSLKPHHSSPLDSLRRNIWPMCRKSLYFFIKHLFIHWPLDSSFRLVLETWLSYIQPWRYVTYSPLERSVGPSSPAEPDLHRIVDPKWKSFIAENLLFCSHLFGLLLKRILRLDLASPKNAQILFRVAKVFSQDNFMSMIQEVEDLLEANQMQKSFLGFVGGLSSPSPLPPTHDPLDGQHVPQVITQMVRSHILEVERPNHHYIPMFGEAVLKDVCNALFLCSLFWGVVNTCSR